MQRTILCTVVEDPITRSRHEVYGRYDPVTLERKGLKIIETYKQLFEMDDQTFAQHAKRKEGKK